MAFSSPIPKQLPVYVNGLAQNENSGEAKSTYSVEIGLALRQVVMAMPSRE